MRTHSRRHRLQALALAASLAYLPACGGSAPAPHSAHAGEPSGAPKGAQQVAPPRSGLQDLGEPIAEVTPPQSETQLGATLGLQLHSVRALIDRELPGKFEQDWQRLTAQGASQEVEARYVVLRDPIALSVEGRRLRVELPLRYHADLRGRVRVPFVNKWLPLSGDLDWGTARNPQRITLAATVDLDLSSDYALSVQTRALPIVHGEPPRGKACVKAGISVCIAKESLAPQVRQRIDRAVTPRFVRALDLLKKRLLASVDPRAQVSALWASAGCPWSLTRGTPVCEAGAAADDLWLRFEPERIGVGELRLSKAGGKHEDLELDLALRGRATVVAGPWPAVEVAPLPPPQRGASAGFDVAVHAQLPYAVIARAVMEALGGESIPAGSLGALNVTRVALDGRRAPDGEARLLLQLHIDGAAAGVIYLWGRPTYDDRRQTLRLTELDYTLETQDRFAKGLDSINHAEFRQELSRRAVIDVGPRIAELKVALEGAMARQLGQGLQASGEVRALSLLAPVLSSDRVLLPVRLRGLLRVTATL